MSILKEEKGHILDDFYASDSKDEISWVTVISRILVKFYWTPIFSDMSSVLTTAYCHCTHCQLSPVGAPPAPAFCRIDIELFADAPFGNCGGADDGIHNSKRDPLIFESKFKGRYSLKYNSQYQLPACPRYFFTKALPEPVNFLQTSMPMLMWH